MEGDLRVRVGSRPTGGTPIIANMSKGKDKPGPKPDRVKIDEDWEKALRKALKKKRPEGGWPKPGPGNAKETDEDSHQGGES